MAPGPQLGLPRFGWSVLSRHFESAGTWKRQEKHRRIDPGRESRGIARSPPIEEIGRGFLAYRRPNAPSESRSESRRCDGSFLEGDLAKLFRFVNLVGQ